MKILVIDDEQIICESIKQILLLADIRNVTTCTDALLAEQMIHKNIYDIVLLDIMMPGKSGDIILDEAKRAGIIAEFILLSALQETPLVVKCLKSGAFNYLVKPPQKDLLISAIQNAEEHHKLKHSIELFSSDDITVPEEFSKKFFTNDIHTQKILGYAAQLSLMDCNILLSGQTGTGKTILAEAIHNYSQRKHNNFIAVNVNAIPDNLFESELFGYKKGAFTGAYSDRTGLVKQADRGTLFLDEIGELSVVNQIKLLKLIEEKKFYPLGSDNLEHSDFRLITASNKNLADETSAGRFRKDLYYRIKSSSITLPPLVKRGRDIIYLAKILLRDLNAKNHTFKEFTVNALTRLLNYEFPGNFRELQYIIENAFYHTVGNLIESDTFEFSTTGDISNLQDSCSSDFTTLTLEEMKEQHIKKILDLFKNKNKAAEILGISTRQLYTYIDKYHLKN